jgi:hypothetical protein
MSTTFSYWLKLLEIGAFQLSRNKSQIKKAFIGRPV